MQPDTRVRPHAGQKIYIYPRRRGGTCKQGFGFIPPPPPPPFQRHERAQCALPSAPANHSGKASASAGTLRPGPAGSPQSEIAPARPARVPARSAPAEYPAHAGPPPMSSTNALACPPRWIAWLMLLLNLPMSSTNALACPAAQRPAPRRCGVWAPHWIRHAVMRGGRPRYEPPADRPWVRPPAVSKV